MLKQRMAAETITKWKVDKEFSAHRNAAVEAALKSSTVGLKTVNDMRAKQQAALSER